VRRPSRKPNGKLDAHPDAAGTIKFYRANEKPYGALSNLYRRPVEFEGITYPTSEHAYQAGKALKPAVRDWIQAAPTPALAAMAAHGLYTWDIVVGIASGRGGSIIDHLREALDPTLWPKIRLGLYNGGWIGRIGETPAKADTLSEFLIHAKRIVTSLQSYGVPISLIRATPPFQLSIRFHSGVSTENMWFVIVDAFKQSGLETGTIVRSIRSMFCHVT